MKTKVFTIVVVLILLFWVFRGSYQGTKCNGLVSFLIQVIKVI